MVPTHRHADGGFYRLCATDVSGKGDDPGVDWVDGVLYQGEDNKIRWTSRTRWNDRFEELEPQAAQDVIVWDDENDSVAAFRVELHEAGDARYLITRTGPASNHRLSPEFIGWMKRVLQVQADMIAQGLHVRDHDFPDLMGDVAAFHAKFGQEYTGKARMLPEDLHDFRVKFHAEETTEYSDEYAKLLAAVEEGDRREILHRLEKQLDALADAVWVVLGTADLQFGRRIFFEAWRRVVKANMAKVRKDVTVDGDGSVDSGRAPKYDIVKPAGWLPPDHSDLIEDNAIFDELFMESNTFNEDAV